MESVDRFFDLSGMLDHFLDPRNVGIIEDTPYKTVVGDPQCGDYIELSVKVENGVIVDIKYLVYGCMGAIATSSALSELAKGKMIHEALSITDDDVINYLGGIPEEKKHCSLLGVRALHDALDRIVT